MSVNKTIGQLRDLLEHPIWREQVEGLRNRLGEVADRSSTGHAVLDRAPSTPWRYAPSLGFVLLLLWNWRLGLALLAGGSTMLAVHWLQDSANRTRLAGTWHRLSPSTLSLLLAVGGGLLATLGSYSLISVWSQAGDRWLAIGIVAQGLVTLSILGLLVWQVGQRRREHVNQRFETLLRDMASPESLVRLVAVRQLQECLQLSSLTPERTQLATDSMLLLLDREDIPAIRAALFEALQAQSDTRERADWQDSYESNDSL